MIYATGDTVTIRPDIEPGIFFTETGEDLGFVGSMRKYRGKTAIITGFENYGIYHLDIDDGEWAWCADMLIVDEYELEESDIDITKLLFCSEV